MIGNNVVKTRFVIPWEAVDLHMNSWEVRLWCLNGTLSAKPRWHLHAPAAARARRGPSPGHGPLGRSPARGHQEGFGSCPGFPLVSLPPTMALLQPWCLGNIWGKSWGEGGFYQPQSHHKEELSFCLSSAKVVQVLHQQGLET